MFHFQKKTYAFHATASTLLLTCNALTWHKPIVGGVALLWYVIFLSFVAGRIAVRSGNQFAIGLLTLLSVIALWGTAFIWLKEYTIYTNLLLAWLLPALGFYWYDHARHEKPTLRSIFSAYFDHSAAWRESDYTHVIVAAYAVVSASAFFLLIHGQTELSIQSPWQTVHPLFFFLYFMASALVLYYALISHRSTIALVMTSCHFLLSSSVALIVYRIGYGYDPFIHRATELIISQTGGINPTPLYYLGQYSLVLFFQQVSGIRLDLIDRALVPVLFSIIAPSMVYLAFSQWLDKRYSMVLALSALALPFGGFIMTVPQNLADIWFLASVAISMLYFKNRVSIWTLYLFALATIVIHPLAGIPLFIFIVLVHLFNTFHAKVIKHPFVYLSMAGIFSFALPLALLASTATLARPHRTLLRALLPTVNWVDKADLLLDLSYLWTGNGLFIIIILALLGGGYLYRHKLLKNNLPFLAGGGMLIVSYFITYFFLQFPALSNHDQPDFIKRLLTLAIYAAGPIILIGVYRVIKMVWEYDNATKIFLVAFGSGMLCISLYASYPRLNQYEPSKFFSVSADDLQAVQTIEHSADPHHIVLANQMVGAAAIQEVGFKQYYANEFFYSLPSGSPHQLNDYFLQMIYGGAKRETMEQAMAYAGVSESYFVVNRYWNNAQRIVDQARLSADEVTTVNNGALYIFKYNHHIN